MGLEKYDRTVLEIIRFQTKDIITTSGMQYDEYEGWNPHSSGGGGNEYEGWNPYSPG